MKSATIALPVVAVVLASVAMGLGQPEGKPASEAPVKVPQAKPDAQPAKAPDQGDKPAGGKTMSEPTSSDPAYVLGYTVDDIDSKPVKLEQYKGKVLLIVNVASRCGYTVQYEGLEKMYKERHDQGFEILGFPANDFMSQEPGTNADIKTFCTTKFNVTFPMFSKISVKGEKQHPMFKQIASLPKPVGEEPSWNFTKYLVDRNGRVVARFAPGVKPDDKDLAAKIDELLASK